MKPLPEKIVEVPRHVLGSAETQACLVRIVNALRDCVEELQRMHDTEKSHRGHIPYEHPMQAPLEALARDVFARCQPVGYWACIEEKGHESDCLKHPGVAQLYKTPEIGDRSVCTYCHAKMIYVHGENSAATAGGKL